MTLISSTNVRVTWIAPFSQGSTISNYKVQIKAFDGTFLDEILCTGTGLFCDVPISKLTSATYNLVKGSQVIAKVAAENSYGPSSFSDQNTVFALIELIPEKPTLAPSRGSLSSTSQIEIVITHLSDSQNGGATITEYNIYVDGTKVSSNFRGT